MGKVLAGLEPQIVFDIFEEITKVPRPSKKEEKIAAWIINFAKENNLAYKLDKLGNIVVKKPATPGMENRKGVVIQGHIDMVCEKNTGVEHDFLNDPLDIYIENDWIRARGTTLGADNGIGVSMGLAVLKSNNIAHPAMELLCTLDEETGLTGAIQLGKDMLDGDILLNLDSEEDGAFTIGCAGGANTSASFKYEDDAVPAGHVAYELTVKGLQGGHSGIEIHDGRANAIKLLNRMLWNLTKKFDLRVSSIKAGTAHNAIPREAFAVITVAKEHESQFLMKVQQINDTMKKEWITKEPNIHVFATSKETPTKVMAKCMQNKLLNSLYAVAHGPIRFSPDVPGLVQTSTNLAIVETNDFEVFVLTSQRSSVGSEMKDVAVLVRTAFDLGGAVVKQGDGYPEWQPNVKSEVLTLSKKLYKDMYGVDAKIEIIHAGLECGLVGEKYPNMDMISFGPTMKDVHSPDERLYIPAVGKCWNFLLELLKNIPVK